MVPVKALVAMGTMGLGIAGMAGVVYLSTTPLALTTETEGPTAVVVVEPIRVIEPDRPTSVDLPPEVVLEPVLIQGVPRPSSQPRAVSTAAAVRQIRMQPCSDWLSMATGPAHRQVRQLCAVPISLEGAR